MNKGRDPMNQQHYNDLLISALLGRKSTSPVLSTMGDALGFPEGDVHATRFYRIFLTRDQQNTITSARVVVDGDLISPCSGYFPETLDEFDYETVLHWCLENTEA